MEVPKRINFCGWRTLSLALIMLCVGTPSWTMNGGSSSRAPMLEGLAQCSDPDQAQKNIRLYAKGDLEACLNLYKQAKQEDNPISQIHIANAYYAMHWAKDNTKNFNTLTAQDLRQ